MLALEGRRLARARRFGTEAARAVQNDACSTEAPRRKTHGMAWTRTHARGFRPVPSVTEKC